MSSHVRTVLSTFLCPLLTVLLLKLSSYISTYYILNEKKPAEVPELELTLFLLLFGFMALLPVRAQVWFGFALLGGTQLVALLDSLYYRFFRDLPSLHLLPAWFQAGRAGQSAGSMLENQDALVLVPIMLYVPILFFYLKSKPEIKYRPWLGLFFFVFASLFARKVWLGLEPVRYEQLQRRFQNIAMARLFGPQFYHYYDAFEWTRIQLGSEGGQVFDHELVAKIVEQSRKSSTQKTPFQGRYQGRDFIFVQLESLEYFVFDAEVDGQKVMPFLNQVKEAGFSFRLFDQTHLGRSADGQFIFLNSLHPPATRPLVFTYPNNHYWGLPKLFLEKGYQTLYFEPTVSSFWNAAIISKSYGFEQSFFQDDLPAKDPKTQVKGWGLTDHALFEHTLQKAAQDPAPFFAYVVTVMCHHPYSESSNVPVDFPPKKTKNMVRRYLRCAAARDQALRELVESLAQTERGRKTVLCFAGDHDANLPSTEMSYQGYPVYPEREAVAVTIASVEEILRKGPRLGPKPPVDYGAQMDLAPSLGHVFSLNMEESVFVGQNLFATQKKVVHHCRVGTWMDLDGKIHESEDPSGDENSDLFRVSEMLLQSDKIDEFRAP